MRPSSHSYFPRTSRASYPSLCDTSLFEPPTPIVDSTHLTPIRNSIIHPLLACSPFQCDFSILTSKRQMYPSRLCNVPTSPPSPLNNLCRYSKCRSQTHLVHLLHSSIAADTLLTRYENSGRPEQPECIESSGRRFARTSISALRRECNIWASSFLEESLYSSRCTKGVHHLPPRTRIRGRVV